MVLLMIIYLCLVVGLVATLYAHAHLGRLVRTHHGATIARVALIGVALGAGAVMAFISDRAAPENPPWLAFALGVVCAHIPASCVLLLKTWRHESPS